MRWMCSVPTVGILPASALQLHHPLTTSMLTHVLCPSKGHVLCQAPRWHEPIQLHWRSLIKAENHVLCFLNYCCLCSIADECRQKNGRAVRIIFTSFKSHFHKGLSAHFKSSSVTFQWRWIISETKSPIVPKASASCNWNGPFRGVQLCWYLQLCCKLPSSLACHDCIPGTPSGKMLLLHFHVPSLSNAQPCRNGHVSSWLPE